MPNKKIAILQSNYIPWKGYFDIIDSVDEFIFYDEMQYTKNDWRNRNKIKTQNGLLWLSIPTETKGHLQNKINEVKITDKRWAKKHWTSISNAYAKAPYFKEFKELFENLYNECSKEKYLCQVNYKFITAISNLLGITTKISFSQDYGLIAGKTERLVDLVKKAKGTTYLSGLAAKNYLDEKLFAEANIKLEWMEYSKYQEYPQLHPPFEHGVSILDLIFNTGLKSIEYIRGNSYE